MRRLLLATLLVSAAAIGYEILLMRLLSIVQWHHFAYMIISLALLGYGASGTAIALLKRALEPRFELAFATNALLFSVTMVMAFVAGQHVSFNALEIVWDTTQFLNLSLIYLVFFVPFFFAAFCIGLAFTCRPDAIRRIYFFDLFGAGLGATAIIALLFAMAPQRALIVIAVLPLLASVFVVATRFHMLGLIRLLWLVSLGVAAESGWPELRISEYKGLTQALQVVGSRRIAESYGPLGMLTIVDSPTVPIRHAPGLSFNTRAIPPNQLAVFTDAGAMSAITQFDGELGTIAYLGDVTAALPYQLLSRPSVLILGAGAGADVLLALFHEAGRIDAVELNPQMGKLVSDTHAGFAGRIYEDPRVSLHIGEARGYIARNNRQYDLIQIALLDSFAASGAGVQGLNESYVYTVEAMLAYLEDLRDGGLIAVTRWFKMPPRDSLKLLATAIDALDQSGVDNPGNRLAMIRSWNTSTLLIKKGDFTSAEIAAIRDFSRRRSFDTTYFPGIRPRDVNRYNVLDVAHVYEGAIALLGDASSDYYERYKFRIEPATDDRPYFFHFFKWRSLPEIIALRKAGGAGLIEWGYLVLVATLLQAVILGALFIFLPLLRRIERWPRGTTSRFGAYFLLLGLAFLFVEMAFIQKFILFLSHPLYSVAVVLSGFLVFAGLGSAFSGQIGRRVAARGHSPVVFAVAAIVLIATTYL
ncbi:MAG: SAM-dependent methyltransferase, partial [Woeseiaceae bacterium]